MGESGRRFGGRCRQTRMPCRRCECGSRVTQKVGARQHSASRRTVRRHALVTNVAVWGTEARGCKRMVCVCPVAWRHAACAFGVTLQVWAVVAGVELAFERVRLRIRLVRTMCCVRMEQEGRLRATICTAALRLSHRSGRDDVGTNRQWAVWGGGMSQEDRVVATSARMKPMGLRCRCVMPPGSLVAAGVHLVAVHDRDAPVRSRDGSQLWRVRMRRGEARKY